MDHHMCTYGPKLEDIENLKTIVDHFAMPYSATTM